MKYLFIILSFCSYQLLANNHALFGVFKSHNQEKLIVKDSLNKNAICKNSIYAELLGCGVLYSVNYERILFSKQGKSLSCRIGYAFLEITEGYTHIVPFVVNYQTSLNKSISFEIGLGTRYIYSKDVWAYPIYKNSFDFIGNVGFRFIKFNHLLLKCDWTPQFTSSQFTIGLHGIPMIYFGFSIGYSF